MRQSLRGSEERRRLIDMQRLFARAMLFVDKPTHPRLRQAMQAGFRPASIQKLQGFVVEAVGELMDEIEASCAATEPFDFIEGFARLLPARVISRFLGFRTVDQAQFLAWSTDIAAFLGSVLPTASEIMAGRDSMLAMSEYIDRCMSSGDVHDDDLLGILMHAQRRGEIEGGAEMLAQCAMVLFAGHETTRHLLGTAVYWLLADRRRWTSLDDPARLPAAVRELLRWDSPVQYTGRRANCAFKLFGQDIRRGDLVLPLIGSANRDPLRYPDPEQIDLNRPVGIPLSFGTGPHVCIGATLTLMEAECAIGALVRRWPQACLADEPQQWIDMPLYRGLRKLKVNRTPSRDSSS
ncbi:cytochrome P450 [Ideonella sp. 4Y16]|uniref:Cytochrome P450 n=2 Tax=Ideonella alba TaxID=2824118 RepID=A0A940YBL8_9BURK|nr:cytochrome P450 [Ideonella alba]MBQ0946562.1 cytochrome P450 [Ideonella alba]